MADVEPGSRMERLREEVIMAALNVVQSRLWDWNHPEDPHSSDSLDLANDNLDDALREWAGLRPGA